MNGGDVEEIAGFLADDVVLVDHHGDGRLVLFTSREDVADEIDNIVNFYYDQVDIDLGSLKALGDNIWSVEGRASEYSARAVASLYPDTGFTGFGCTIKPPPMLPGQLGRRYVGGFAGDNSGEITGSYDRQTTAAPGLTTSGGPPKPVPR